WPARLRRLLSEQVGLILRRTIDTDRLLTEYGLDSLSSQELRARVEAETGIRISATDINTTVRGLADLMYDKLAADKDAPAPA
ncbi:acyl carrier protein, partial [Mycobacterium shinjukuense]